MRIRDDNCRRIYRMLLFSSLKGGHWETEKAESSNDLKKGYDISRKTCYDVVPYGNDFFACKKADNHRNSQLW